MDVDVPKPNEDFAKDKHTKFVQRVLWADDSASEECGQMMPFGASAVPAKFKSGDWVLAPGAAGRPVLASVTRFTAGLIDVSFNRGALEDYFLPGCVKQAPVEPDARRRRRAR